VAKSGPGLSPITGRLGFALSGAVFLSEPAVILNSNAGNASWVNEGSGYD